MSRLKKGLLVFAGVLLLVFSLAWCGAFFYEDEVKNLIISNINKNLDTPVQVKDIQFSFIRKFPSATLEFTDVSIEGKGFKETGKHLLKAHKLNLNFNLWDVFGDQVALKKIEVKEGSAFIYINGKGEENYDIWKSNDKQTGGGFQLALEEVILKGVFINFINFPSAQDYDLLINSGKLGGKFSNDEYDLQVNAEIQVDKIEAEKVTYIQKKEALLDLSLHVNRVSNIYNLNYAKLKVADLELNTKGSITSLKEGNKIALIIQSENAGLKELLSLLPDAEKSKLKQYNYNGRINFTASIDGISTKFKTPLIKATFSSANTSIKPADSDLILERIRFNGFYTNRKSPARPVSMVSFSNVSAVLDRQPLSGSILIENLSSPWVSGNVTGNINLQTLSAFYKPDTINSMKGHAKINLQFAGQSGNAAGYTSTGTINLEHVSFTIKQKAADFEEFNGLFTFSGNQFNINNLIGQAAGSDFTIKGSIDNFFTFLFQKNQTLTGKIQLTSRNLDLNELLEDKKKTNANDTAYYLDISEHFNMLLDLNIGIISFKKFQAWNLKGNIAVRNKILSTNNLSFNSMSGQFKLAGAINTQQSQNILISCNAKVIKIDINQLFYETGNFGQDIIQDNNLRGILTADVMFSGVWTKSFHCYMDKIVAHSNFTIEQGELIKFQPMFALSKYIKGADLQNIKFSTLKNTIEIKQEKIIIPAMEIKSSALELMASGTHTFDNMVDYKVQLFLSQITGKKVKEMNTEFGKIADDGLGRTKIFLTVKGPMADPKIKYDSEGMEEKIVNDIRKENQNLKSALNKEFGWFKKDTTLVKDAPQKKKKEELQLERGDND